MTDSHSVNPQVPCNAQQITYQPVPMLRLSASKTVNASANKKYKLTGRPTHWRTFEQEVRTLTSQILDPHAYPITYDTRSFRDTESVICATENGVVGRFQQQVGHVVNNVARHVNRPYRLGDWYKGNDNHFIPDIALWESNEAGNMRIVAAGEAKTPWTVEDWAGQLVPSHDVLYGDPMLCVGRLSASF